MITIPQIADHINQTKPYAELKQMWTEVNPNNVDECINSLLDEPFTMLNAFKLELLLSYGKTHRHSRISDGIITKYKTNTQPYYVLTDLNEQKLNEPVSYTPNINEYLAWLKDGISKFK